MGDSTANERKISNEQLKKKCQEYVTLTCHVPAHERKEYNEKSKTKCGWMTQTGGLTLIGEVGAAVILQEIKEKKRTMKNWRKKLPGVWSQPGGLPWPGVEPEFNSQTNKRKSINNQTRWVVRRSYDHNLNNPGTGPIDNDPCQTFRL